MKQLYCYGQKYFFIQKRFWLKKLSHAKFIFLLMFLALSSCNWLSQNPLKGKVSEELLNGVLETGPQNWAPFSEVIVDKMLKVEIKGQKDLTMGFKEAEEKSYSIQFRFLNGFDKYYEILMDDNVFKSSLTDSQWNYQADQSEGVLSWKPRPGFNRGQKYTSFNISFTIKLKKKAFPDKNQILNVSRQIKVYVDKKVFGASVRKVSVWDGLSVQTYVRLDDRQFYRSQGLSHLDLSYYDELFLSFADFSINEGRIINYDELFSSQENVIIYPDEGLLDQNKDKIDEALIPFIQQSYYYFDDCDGKTYCLLEDRSFVPIDTDLYTQVYKVPENITSDQIYYKLESPILCQIHYKESYAYIIDNLPDEKANHKEKCYLALKFFRDSLKELRESDNNNIYFLENKKLKQLDISNWRLGFKKIPESIKWNLGRQKPVKDNIIRVHLQYNRGIPSKRLIFEVEDKNEYFDDVHLVRNQTINEIAYWSFPVVWKLVDNELQFDKKTVKLNYLLNAQKSTYQSQTFDLTAFTQTVAGDTVSIEVILLPLVVVDETHQFFPEQDVILEQIFTESLGQKNWMQSSLKLNKQLKRTYIFPTEFYSNLADYKASSQLESLQQNINLKMMSPQSEYCQTENSCVCSDFSFYQKEKSQEIYAEQQCVYETQMDFKKLANRPQKPVYARQIHSLNEPEPMIGLKQTDVMGQALSDQVVRTEEQFYNLNPDSSKEVFDPDSVFSANWFHVFFDLQPELICDPISNQTKDCTIRYLFETKEETLYLLKWNDPDTGLLSQKGLNMQCVQNSPSGLTKCDCQQGKLEAKNPTKRTYNPKMGVVINHYDDTSPLELILDFECSFSAQKDNLSIEFFLQANHPNIFLLNKTNQQLKQSLTTIYNITQGEE